MWDDYETKRRDKPYLWILFFLLLLGLSSIFIWRPGTGLRPVQEDPGVADKPVVTVIDEATHGRPLFSADGVTGVWVAHAQADRIVVRFLSAFGDELWAETVPVADALIASNGRYLVVGEVGQPKFYVYHARQKLVGAISAPGGLQAVSISQTGAVVAAFTVPAVDPLALRTEVALYSALGQQMWRHNLTEALPIAIRQSADGDTVAVLSLSFLQDLGGSLAVFSRHGERMFSQHLPGRPGLLALSDDGERIAVTVGNSIHVYSRQGDLILRHDAGGAVESIGSLGQTPNLVFTMLRKSLLNLRPQHHVVVLGDKGQILSEHRSSQPIVALGTRTGGSDIFIGTATSATLTTYSGEPRWSLSHVWQGEYRVSTLDGANYLVIQHDGQVVQVRGD